jgi:hypothetical protein
MLLWKKAQLYVSTTALVYGQLHSSLYTGAVQGYWSTPDWSDRRQRRYSPTVREQSSRTVQMYSKVYGRVRGVGAAGWMRASPRPHPQPCLTASCMYVCEHFANKVRELLVNIASGGVGRCPHCDHYQLDDILYEVKVQYVHKIQTVQFLPKKFR